jgi:hypothetical protein
MLLSDVVMGERLQAGLLERMVNFLAARQELDFSSLQKSASGLHALQGHSRRDVDRQSTSIVPRTSIRTGVWNESGQMRKSGNRAPPVVAPAAVQSRGVAIDILRQLRPQELLS